MFAPESVSAFAPILLMPKPPVMTALTVSEPLENGLKFDVPSSVMPPVCTVPTPPADEIVPPLIVTAFDTTAPWLTANSFAPMTIVPVPATPALSRFRIPPLMVVPPL